MSKLDEVLEKCTAQLEKSGVKTVDANLLKAIAKSLGPSIYNKDSLLVAAKDKDEVARIKKNLFEKKLGITDEAKQEKAIADAIEAIGSRTSNKMRPAFYYLIVKATKKSGVYK